MATACWKPLFWNEATPGPHPPNKFIVVDRSKANYNGDEHSKDELNNDVNYLMGNVADMEAYFERILE